MRARSHDELRGHCWCAHAARSSQQVRFWDVASGQQVRQVLGDEYALVEGDAAQHQAGRHILTASENMLLIYEGGAEGGGRVSRGVLQGAGDDHIGALLRREHLRGVRPWRSVHSAGAVSGCVSGAAAGLVSPRGNEHGYSRGSGEGEQRGAGGEGERSRPWHSRCSFRTPPLAPLPRGRGLPRAAHARSPQPRPRAVRPLARPGPLLWRLPAREPIIASVPRRAGQDLENSPSPRPGRFPGPEAGPGNWRHLAAGPRHPNRNFVSIMLRTVAVNFSQLIRFERFTFCNLEVFYTQF